MNWFGRYSIAAAYRTVVRNAAFDVFAVSFAWMSASSYPFVRVLEFRIKVEPSAARASERRLFLSGDGGPSSHRS